MSIKNFVPLSLRLLLVKLNWFRKNYKLIHYNSEIFNNIHGQLTYNTDGLATSNNCDFINDPRFAAAYEAARKTNPWPNFTLMWRVYTVCWYADLVKELDGDFVECGVNTGAYSRAIIEYINFAESNKTFYLMDTFQGLDPRFITEEEKSLGISNYNYRDCYEEVLKTFAPFRTKIIRGAIPETLSQCDAQKICYLSIDMNNKIPEIAALEYFWPRIVRQGVILLDDYGFPMHIHQKIAFDEFAKKVNHEIYTMPTGQGLIIKKT